ncbi:MAG: hypothetical protein EBZ87_06280 [Microbacteriaceae bacterium]|nr:hypothetical protein [Microbacteriaceae bacterium]
MDIKNFLSNELLAEASSDGNWYLWDEGRKDALLLYPNEDLRILKLGLPFWDNKGPAGVHIDHSTWILDKNTQVVETDGGLWFFRELDFEFVTKNAVLDGKSFLENERQKVSYAANRELEIRDNELLKVVSWLNDVYSDGQEYDGENIMGNFKKLDEISLSMVEGILSVLTNPNWRADTSTHNTDEEFEDN